MTKQERQFNDKLSNSAEWNSYLHTLFSLDAKQRIDLRAFILMELCASTPNIFFRALNAATYRVKHKSAHKPSIPATSRKLKARDIIPGWPKPRSSCSRKTLPILDDWSIGFQRRDWSPQDLAKLRAEIAASTQYHLEQALSLQRYRYSIALKPTQLSSS